MFCTSAAIFRDRVDLRESRDRAGLSFVGRASILRVRIMGNQLEAVRAWSSVLEWGYVVASATFVVSLTYRRVHY